ncbi:hypothetical protein, partial [Paraburkholderia sp. EG304]|uniref:hypothetical protein n=1 Tax=Paraburkholderia sp. EG304 TaxID=3237015 RepID=UPI00397C212A
MVADEIARLELPDPVPACGGRQRRFVQIQIVLFGASFVELRVVEAAEYRRQAAQRPDDRKLVFDKVNRQREL